MNYCSRLFNWALPNLCVCCRQPIRAPAKICRVCLSDIERLSFKSSANLLHHPDINKLIPNPTFDSLFAACWYQHPASTWLKGIKFNKQLTYKAALHQLIKAQMKDAQAEQNWQMPDVLMPVPLHWQRRVVRGFNQSEEIWQRTGIAVDTKSIVRTKRTKPQSELNKRDRKTNIKGAFSCELKHQYQHVAIVDDIITTGYTVNEIARLLKSAGVKQVSVWVFAISDPSKPS
ncbi:phosphoribosyltransferase family protein [Pseudoalteromonas sp. MMG024]|uniref:ComF family protein n=1 Tax=Pseudoalteromonas sp. MMG024 TaxID=2909980 RepID=UPI001F2C36A9|nr:phosphoribosyltransferase family protein [Pseudoalteromonas sp. MMG024]MCF6456413.1 ComF family protein [Pseudoalteromonas sp. MMG024]